MVCRTQRGTVCKEGEDMIEVATLGHTGMMTTTMRGATTTIFVTAASPAGQGTLAVGEEQRIASAPTGGAAMMIHHHAEAGRLE
jgi:hypothetical protein